MTSQWDGRGKGGDSDDSLITYWAPLVLSLPQVCALVRCAGSTAASCGQEVSVAESRMDFLLEGVFANGRHVYPSVLASRMVLEQPEAVEVEEGGGEGATVRMRHSNMTAGLITACLYGRVYHLDDQ